ncbi:S-adenosyl-L-methionine-dependent methyltransferase [Dothidotthia symphoricarpi CBS 119687]|uniref:S-adenosyl-L-methionine-dependent methyltransferase n=1 Tax=Dothidotthia symphoricarpi CBS 119687 TaxID=1392245 RepID=A0A6A6ARA0_9PLEO|nr:S-adenosyl-L-methionine-dependent methyltransferase [Dothidotthia symphoricarpi CBS 119687]KAF2134340.1 S-adenosyl-L-methionine-dependent methyltransferase [Dothidotthia symphoricarpi CBS 119687]
MRYIRFLKTPRIVVEKGTSRRQIHCLITITSDLGDSFLPYDVELSAELLSSQNEEQTIVWKTVQWTSGMRSLAITLPLPKSSPPSLRVKVGTDAKSTHDEYSALSGEHTRGIVSAWSAPFSLSTPAMKLAERRFTLPSNQKLHIWEETGESIARHIWDAGITLSCHIYDIASLLPPPRTPPLHILELGTGCGTVGISLAQLLPNAHILLTDLPEATDIVSRNIRAAKPANGSSLTFATLDWDADLPRYLPPSIDLVLAADCTYNPDSSPALVRTLGRLAEASTRVVVAVAMKMRHSSEEVFFKLMEQAGFEEVRVLEYKLPGDVETGEEVVYLHVYGYGVGKGRDDVAA